LSISEDFNFLSTVGDGVQCVPDTIHLSRGTIRATSADISVQEGDIFYRDCSGKGSIIDGLAFLLWLTCVCLFSRVCYLILSVF